MSDEKFEEFLQRESKAYNEPPAMVPRDEMWLAVSKAREARRAADTTVVATPSHRRSNGIRRHSAWIGMAATLLIGVGIGRFAMRQGAEVTPPEVRTASAPIGIVTGDTAERGAPAAPHVGVLPDVFPIARQAAVRTPAGGAPAAGRTMPSLATNGANGTAGTTAYGVVSQRHLASAEALITVVTAAPRDAMMDSLTTRWAREMLSSTRLLLDSPAGDDALRRRLLEDLETLLVQLVQRSGGAVDERDLIDRTLQRTQLLTRLRTNTTGT